MSNGRHDFFSSSCELLRHFLLTILLISFSLLFTPPRYFCDSVQLTRIYFLRRHHEALAFSSRHRPSAASFSLSASPLPCRRLSSITISYTSLLILRLRRYFCAMDDFRRDDAMLGTSPYIHIFFSLMLRRLSRSSFRFYFHARRFSILSLEDAFAFHAWKWLHSRLALLYMREDI